MPLCVTRAYAPSTTLDLETVDLTRSFWGTYSDAAAEGEFRRFVNRDLASTIVGLIFGPGAAFYAAAQVTPQWHVSIIIWSLYVAGGALTGPLLLFDLYLLWRRKTLAARAAFIRQVLAYCYGVAVLNAVALFVAPIYLGCLDTTDYLGYLYDRPAMTEDRVQRECVDVMSPYVIIGLGLAFTVLHVPPFATVIFSVLLMALYYTGYAIDSLLDHGESVRELVAKLLVYLTFGVACAVLKLVRYRTYQAQFETTLATDRERRRATRAADEVDGMLQAMVPGSALERLLAGEAVRDRVESASVLFSDMAGFTAWSSSRTAAEVVEMLNVVCTRLDAEAEARGVVKIKTIGDAYWAATGIPEELGEHADVLCGFAQRMHGVVAEEVASHPHWGGVKLRVGVASGPVDGGIFGTSRLSYEVSGATCDLASLCEQRGEPLRVCVCSRTRALVEDGDAADQHVSIDAPGGGTEQLWLLQDNEMTRTASSGLPTSLQQHRPPSVGSMASTVRAPAPAAQNSAAAAKRRFLAARAAAMRQIERSTGGGGSSSQHTTPLAVATSEYLSHTASRTRLSRRETSFRGATPKGAVHRSPSPRAAALAPGAIVSTSPSLQVMSVSTMGTADGAGGATLGPPPLTPPHGPANTSRSPSVSPREAAYMQQQGAGEMTRLDPSASELRASVPTVQSIEAPVVDDEGADEDAEAAAVRLSQRKYNWVIMTFQDDALETKFAAFVEEKQLPIRRSAHAMLLSSSLAICVGLAVEGEASAVGGIVCAVLACALSLACVVLAGVGTVAPWADGVLIHVSVVLMIAGLWQLEWQSLFGHDTTFFHTIATVAIGFGISVWPSAVLLLLNLVCVLLPIAVQTRDSVWISGNIFFLLFSSAILCVAFVGQEKLFRRQFVELAVAQKAIVDQARRSEEQEALLLAIVPPHAVTPLTTWLSKGKDAAHAVSDTFSLLNVAFIRLVQPESHSPVSPAGAGAFASWLFAAHTAVDEVLDAYGRWLDKVKTMGDTVMVAGPFRSTALAEEAAVGAVTSGGEEESPGDTAAAKEARRRGGQQAEASVRASAAALLEAVRELREAGGGSFICGLHAGEVKGVVLGTSRLCYDVFGDAVNTASRTMTSLRGALQDEHAGGAYCAVSAEYRALVDAEVALQEAGGGPLAGLRFSGARSAQAKGKASLEVHAATFGMAGAPDPLASDGDEAKAEPIGPPPLSRVLMAQE